MKIFKLPDLGEGLPDAEINEWHVAEGDTVTLDQLLVSMETAKALVDVPSPRAGTIAKLHGKVGDIIKTHTHLVEFTDGEEEQVAKAPVSAATVAGNIVMGDTILQEAAAGIQVTHTASHRVSVIPALRALAKRLSVDLATVTGTGPNQRITAADIHLAASAKSPTHATNTLPSSMTGQTEALRGVRRTMAHTMVTSHQRVVPTTIVDDADIHAWLPGTDLTVRIIQAIVDACQVEPALNAHFDGQSLTRTLADAVHLGIALDSADGLFVPVIKDADQQSPADLRMTINRYKQQVTERSIPADDLQGATIIFSNFGVFAGRYASPIIIPPMVAILAVGRMRYEPVAVQDTQKNHPILPLSLTFDHRAVTGGEASRFLGVLIEKLNQPVH